MSGFFSLVYRAIFNSLSPSGTVELVRGTQALTVKRLESQFFNRHIFKTESAPAA